MGALSLLQLIAAAAVMFAGATVLSTVGFGIGMVTTPFLLLILDPQTVVVMVNTVSLALFLLIIYHSRYYLKVRETLPLALAGLAGVPIGVLFLKEADERLLRIAITAVIIALAVLVPVTPPGRLKALPRARLAGLPVAFAVGVMLTSLGIGGPLMALFLLTQDWPRHSVRTSLSLYFLVVELSGVVGYGVAGLFTAERVLLITVVTAPVLLGFWLATRLLRHMNETAFQRATVVVIVATSLMVLGREVAGL